jgi:hypothetical protein
MSTRRRLAVSLATAVAVAVAVSLVTGLGGAGAAPAPAGCPTNGSFDNTIPTPVGPPTATSYYNQGHPHNVGYSAVGSDAKLYTTFTDVYTGRYSPNQLFCLGALATDAPGVFEYGEEQNLAVFVRVSNGKLYQRYVTGDYTSTGAYTVVNDAASTNGPAALEFDGQFHLFVRGTNGALYHGFRQTGLSSWRWEKIGGAIVGSPVAVVDGNRMLVAVVGANRSIYTVTGTNFVWGPFGKIVNQVDGNTPTQIMTKTPPSLVRNMRTGAISMYAASSGNGLFELDKPAAAGFANRLWERIDSVLPSDARISAAVNVHNDTVVYARFLDRSSGRYITTYTERGFLGDGWTDYFLAPYTCFNCAPSPAGAGPDLASRAGTAGAHRTGLAPMPRTTVVLRSTTRK